jgi:hypothetical protein
LTWVSNFARVGAADFFPLLRACDSLEIKLCANRQLPKLIPSPLTHDEISQGAIAVVSSIPGEAIGAVNSQLQWLHLFLEKCNRPNP